ncbi:hypothetical protein [Mammaliicoccus sciuri]|uniref:hypothetical protein n=1 Tax=Mammaliicoccus sciuri TaxID=1296 RepID=UPI003A93B06A
MKYIIQNLADEFKEEILSDNEEMDTAYYYSEITPEIAFQVDFFIAKHFNGPLVSVIINSIDRILELKERVLDEEIEDVLLTEYRDIVLDVFYMYAEKQEVK